MIKSVYLNKKTSHSFKLLSGLSLTGAYLIVIYSAVRYRENVDLDIFSISPFRLHHHHRIHNGNLFW